MNLSGRWVLDRAQSVGLPRGAADVVLVITQTPAQLVVARHANETTVATTYALDGTETVRTGNDGTMVKSRSWWRDAALVIESSETRSLLGVRVVIPSTETYRILSDGSLVIELNVKAGGKELHRKSAFTRARD